MFYLQNRWKLQGNKLVYYGLRNRENLFQNEIRLTRRQAAVIAALPCALSDAEQKILGTLLHSCVVTEQALRPVPKTLHEARFCTRCAANDFIIPGLEFDENGLCPMCQTEAQTRNLRSLMPIVTNLPRAKNSRFDVALFYTGGKDSTYLLYHLSRVLKLRVLALTWEIPFMSPSAKQSMENAKRRFPNVEFISRWVSSNDLAVFYKKLYSLSENTCACPSLAYVLFYPELVANRVPYFVAGNEPAQMLGLYYNHMAPRFAYGFAKNRLLHLLVNVGRVLTLHPPLRSGQLETLLTMKTLAFGSSTLQNALGYKNELVENVVAALRELPQMLRPFQRSVRRSSRSGNIPAFVHFDLDAVSGGRYDWRETKQLIAEQCGWVAPEQGDKALHTSCSIERCKEHSQFARFYHCRSRLIPLSALEIALASRDRNLTREQAIAEMEQAMGFTLNTLPECAAMRAAMREDTP